MKTKHVALIALVAALALAACSPDQQAALGTAVAETLTLQALLTAAAPATDTPPPPDTPIPSDTPAPSATPTPGGVAPDPLPATHTGIALNIGECFDFDSGQIVAADAASCDMWLKDSILIEQMKGSQISGYVTFTAPTKSDCQAALFDPNDLAIQTDLHMCFITADGTVGFVVARSYLGAVPFTGFSFDYWVFD